MKVPSHVCDTYICPLDKACEEVKKPEGTIALEEDRKGCTDSCVSFTPITDSVEIKDTDDVTSSICILEGGPESGAYTVDALNHAKFGLESNEEVPNCVILAHHVD